MDKNWLLDEEISQYNAQGIVLIDELETHLHIELQKKILPFLTKIFPEYSIYCDDTFAIYSEFYFQCESI